MYVRCAVPIVHPRGRAETLVHRGNVERAGVEMKHVEQVACGAGNSKVTKKTEKVTNDTKHSSENNNNGAM